MDFYTNATFQVQKGCGLGSRDLICKFLGLLNNFRTNQIRIKFDIRIKFGTDIEDGLSLHMDHKTTPKWAWLQSRDLISKF